MRFSDEKWLFEIYEMGVFLLGIDWTGFYENPLFLHNPPQSKKDLGGFFAKKVSEEPVVKLVISQLPNQNILILAHSLRCTDWHFLTCFFIS